MYNLFNEPLGTQPKELTFNRLDYLINQQRSNLKRVEDYYKNQSGSVKSNHILVQILQTLPVDPNLPTHQYLFMISDYIDEIASTFNLAYSTNYGSALNESAFLSDNVEEIIILNKERFDNGNVSSKWKDIKAIRFLSHPGTDLNLDLPNGQNYSGPGGVSVITINLPLLALQYRLWKESVKHLENTPTTMQFIYRYVLPNMINSYQDVSMFNITYKLFIGEKLENINDHHPFYLNSFYEETIEEIGEVIRTRLKRKESFYEFLEATSLMGDKSLRKVIELPKLPKTRQVIWSLILARLFLADMLIIWDLRTGGSHNKEEIKKLKRSLKQITNDKNISSILGRDLKKQTEEFIKIELIDALK